MASQNGDQASGRGGRWEGYSDYQTVSQRIGRSIGDAIEGYAIIKRLHVENARISGEDAAEASSRILAAAMRLVPEMKTHRDDQDEYDKILNRWLDGESDDVDEQVPDEGYVAAFQTTSLRDDCPDWLNQFVLDLRAAGWHLGYLQAGRRTEEEPDDPVEADARAMFD